MQGISLPSSTHDDDRLEVQLLPIAEMKSSADISSASVRANDDRNSTTDGSEDHVSHWQRLGNSDGLPKLAPKHRVRSIGQATKAKAKKVFHAIPKGLKKEESQRDTDDEIYDEEFDENEILKDVKRNPAFSPKQLVRKDGFSVSGTIDATLGTTKGTLRTVAHPRRALKAKVAKKLATPDHPYLSPEADVQLLDAHEEMVRIQSSRTTSSAEGSSDLESERGRLEKKVHNLESDREKARVAWITSRHVFRVRAVPKHPFDFPLQSDYYDRNEAGSRGRFRYERYIGALMLYYSQDFTSQYIDDFNTLPLNRDTLIRHLERLVMVSAPWQEWFVNVRRIYRWEDPKKSTKWLAIILCIWYYNHMVTFLYSYLIFVTLRRQWHPETVQEIRRSYERALSRGTQAFKLSELIRKHGNDKWLDPLLDEIGPIVQLQIGDLADLLEVYQNCYDWKDPWATTYTLLFLSTCILVGHFTSTEFSVKILEWIGIIYFFFSRPISSLYPRYRHIVSPIKWITWDIPTHSEWAFRYLRREAQDARAAIVRQRVIGKYLSEETDPAGPVYRGNMELPTITRTTSTGDKAATVYDSDDSATSYNTACSSTSVVRGQEMLSFRCRWRSSLGRLKLYGSGLGFSSSLPTRGEQWSRSYIELVELRKQTSESRVERAATIEMLQFHWADGTIDEVFETRGCRDEMFNCVLGFSGQKWQALQPLEDSKLQRKGEKESGNDNGMA